MSDTSITVIYHAMSLTVLYQYHQDEWYVYHSDLSRYVSDCTVSVSPRRVIRLSQWWFIMLCLWLLYQYHQDEWYVYHSDLSRYVSDYCISITKMSDISITMIYHAMSLTTVSISLRRVISLSQWFITLCLWLLYQYHQEEWYLYHNDLSRYVSDYCISITKKSDISITMIYHAMSLTTVSVSLRRVISLSQWFITLCLWLLYQYHQDEWYIYHSDLLHYVSDYCISITKMSDTSITVIYHAMSLTTVSVSLRRVIHLSQWFIMLCLWLLYQYH
jgi:hypothetical protein